MNDTTRVPHWRAFEQVRAATARYRATLARYSDAIAGLAIIDEQAEVLADAIDATLAEPPALATVAHLYRLVHEIEPPAAESWS